jgi:hypothetical protein
MGAFEAVSLPLPAPPSTGNAAYAALELVDSHVLLTVGVSTTAPRLTAPLPQEAERGQASLFRAAAVLGPSPPFGSDLSKHEA